MTARSLVLDVVGLTPRLLAHMPRLRAVADGGFQAALGTVLPAVTCSVQSTFLTGELPAEHGIVGNGWYFRDLGEVLLWRQHNALVGGEKLWDAARRVEPGYTVANVCWWYAMGADVDWTVTPRPIYYADGRKEPDCYTDPPELHDELTAALGTFPLFNYWGPTRGHRRRRAWIAGAAEQIMLDHDPRPDLVYLPHLDYDLQRFGPSAPARPRRGRAELDAVLGAAAGRRARRAATTVVVLSEYGITDVSPAGRRQPAAARRGAAARLHPGRDGVPRPVDLAGVRGRRPPGGARLRRATRPTCRRCAKLCAALPGVAEVLDDAGKAAHGLDHPRAGELVAGRRARRLVHLLLLARRRARARLRPRWWRSTASPATTRPSCSSTRPRRARRSAVRRWRCPQEARHALHDERRRPGRGRAGRTGSHGRLPADPATARCCSAPTGPRSGPGWRRPM